MNKITLLLVALLFFGFQGYTQNSEVIGDRPDQTESAFLVPKGLFQLEAGFTYDMIDSEENNISVPTFLLRYGIWEHFELRLASDFAMIRGTENDISGFAPISPGIKIFIREQDGFLPQMAFLAHIDLPNTGHSDFQLNKMGSSFVFTFENSLTDNIALGYNLGAFREEDNPTTMGFQSVVLGFSLGDKTGIFVEEYGTFGKATHPDNRIDMGITYKITPTFQIDLAGGIGLSELSNKGFIAFGFCYRITD